MKRPAACLRDENDKGAKSEKQRPDDANDAPGCFVMNDAVGHEGANAHDGEETQSQGSKQKSNPTQD